MHIIDIFARVFISSLFLLAGTEKIFNYEGSIEYMEIFGVPDFFLIPAIVIEILFPILLILGYKTKLSALILSIFSIILALIFHRNFTDPMQLMSFLKNFAIAGGLLILFINGPGLLSLDHKNKRNSN